MTVTISPEQRSALYAHIYDRLDAIGDVRMAAYRGDYESAQRLAQSYADELQLLCTDLGWGEGTAKPVELTTPAEVLRRCFARVGKEAAGMCDFERESAAQVLELQRPPPDLDERVPGGIGAARRRGAMRGVGPFRRWSMPVSDISPARAPGEPELADYDTMRIESAVLAYVVGERPEGVTVSELTWALMLPAKGKAIEQAIETSIAERRLRAEDGKVFPGPVFGAAAAAPVEPTARSGSPLQPADTDFGQQLEARIAGFQAELRAVHSPEDDSTEPRYVPTLAGRVPITVPIFIPSGEDPATADIAPGSAIIGLADEEPETVAIYVEQPGEWGPPGGPRTLADRALAACGKLYEAVLNDHPQHRVPRAALTSIGSFDPAATRLTLSDEEAADAVAGWMKQHALSASELEESAEWIAEEFAAESDVTKRATERTNLS